MKKIYTEDGELIINVNKQCFFVLSTEWTQFNFRKKQEWITITPIHIFFEREYYIDAYVFQIVILGFGVSFRYNTKEALKLFAKWKKEARDERKKKSK